MCTLTGWYAVRFDFAEMRRAFALVLISAAVLSTPAALASKKPAAKKAAAAKKAPPPVKGTVSKSESALSESVQASSPPPSRGPTRIDFDDRLIQGQTNKSGAVYLYDRKELKTRSMIKRRENFREEIIGSLYDT